MWKRIVSAAMVGVMLFTSLGAGAATGRISTNVPANWRYGGSPHVSGADKQCATSAPAVATVIAKAEACVKSYILSHDSPGVSSRFIGEGAVQMNGTQGRMKDFTVAVGKNQTGHKVLMYFWGDCGNVPGAIFKSDGSGCIAKESVKDCIERQDLPNRVALTNARKGCLATEATDVAYFTTFFDRSKNYSVAVAALVAAYMAKRGSTLLSVLFIEPASTNLNHAA